MTTDETDETDETDDETLAPVCRRQEAIDAPAATHQMRDCLNIKAITEHTGYSACWIGANRQTLQRWRAGWHAQSPTHPFPTRCLAAVGGDVVCAGQSTFGVRTTNATSVGAPVAGAASANQADQGIHTLRQRHFASLPQGVAVVNGMSSMLWCARRDSNPRPFDPKSNALSPELRAPD